MAPHLSHERLAIRILRAGLRDGDNADHDDQRQQGDQSCGIVFQHTGLNRNRRATTRAGPTREISEVER